MPYFNVDGSQIQKDEYEKLRKENPNHWVIREYENSRVRVRMIHIDHFDAGYMRRVPKEHRMYVIVECENIIDKDYEGNPIHKAYIKDVSATKEFRNAEDATGYYTKFLIDYTESEYDADTGELIEVGNVLVPPKPPSPDVPTVSEDSEVADEFGSW